jgi:hypothetical protein
MPLPRITVVVSWLSLELIVSGNRGTRGTFRGQGDQRLTRLPFYNLQSMPFGALCGDSRHDGLLVAVFELPWRDVEVSYDRDPTRFVGNGHRNTILVSKTSGAKYSQNHPHLIS